MDPLSITTACVSLVATVTTLSIKVHGFVRVVRDARGDLDAVNRELSSLKTVLEILGEDATNTAGTALPPSLVKQISGILTNCGGVLKQIETSLDKHSGGRIRQGIKWTLAGQDDMNKLRSSLEAHKSALDIALDMVVLTLAREIKADTEEIINTTVAIKDDTTAIKDDTNLILAEIARLQERLPQEDRILNGHGFTLQRYLDNLSSYAETCAELSDAESDSGIDVGAHQDNRPNLEESTQRDIQSAGIPHRIPGPEHKPEPSSKTVPVVTSNTVSHSTLQSNEPPPTEPSISFSSSPPPKILATSSKPTVLASESSFTNREDHSTTSPTVETTASFLPNQLSNKILEAKSDSECHVSSSATDISDKKESISFINDYNLEGHESTVFDVAFSPDGQLLASASMDKTIRLWNPVTRVACGVLEGHTGWVRAISFSPNGKVLASASRDGTIRLWDLATGTTLGILDGNSSDAYDIAYSPDGMLIASISGGLGVLLWDPTTKKPYAGVRIDFSSLVMAIAFSPNGKILASACWNKTVQLSDVATGKSLAIFDGHSKDVRCVAYSPDGTLIASAPSDMTIQLWDTTTEASFGTLVGHTGMIKALQFSPNGTILASASEDTTIRLWDLATKAALLVLNGGLGTLYAIAFSPDGTLMASGSSDFEIKLWKIVSVPSALSPLE